jgi:hypothetical protein
MTTVTICGSLKSVPREHWDDLAQRESLKGHVVLTVNVWTLRDYLHTKDGEEVKRQLDILHKKKIAMSDIVYVLTNDGYIGSSTQSEIDFAASLEIPIVYRSIS